MDNSGRDDQKSTTPTFRAPSDGPPRRNQTGPIESRHQRHGPSAARSGVLIPQQVPPSDSSLWADSRLSQQNASANAVHPEPGTQERAERPPRIVVGAPRSAIFTPNRPSGSTPPGVPNREVTWGAVYGDSNAGNARGPRAVAFSGPLGPGGGGTLHRRSQGGDGGRTGFRSPGEISNHSNMSGVLGPGGAPPRSGILTKTVIMCMDPTCNSCPPEMHAYRNLKMMKDLQKEAAEEAEEQGHEAHKESELPSLLQDLELFDDEFEEEEEDEEGAKKMVVRICGIPIAAYKSKASEKRRVPGWLSCFRVVESFSSKLPVFNPNSPFMKKYTKWFVMMGLLGFFIDPLFFFSLGILSSPPNYMCMTINWSLAISFCIARFLVDIWYMLHIAITFRTAYIVPAPKESRWPLRRRDPPGVSPGDMVFDPKFIAHNYLWASGLVMDVLCAIPVPQVIILAILPSITNSYSFNSNSNTTVALLSLALLLQAIPRALRLMYKFSSEESNNGSLFESAWASFLLNMAYYLMVSHIVGAMWYLFSVARVSECFKDQCNALGQPLCYPTFLYCPKSTKSAFFGPNSLPLDPAPWASSQQAAACLDPGSGNCPLAYGIFTNGVILTVLQSFFQKYFSALYWGFQQVSTMAGNQTPSPWVPEVLFIFVVAATGLLLLALLIGSMSNFLQSLSRRSFEHQMNCLDVELWMSRRNIPVKLQKKVKNSLRLQWATTKGVEDVEVLKLLTEDLQRDLRSKLCENLLTASPLFKAMKQGVPKVLDAFIERLQQRIYIEGTEIVKEGYPVSRLFFILKGSVTRFSTRTMDLGQDMMGKGDFLGEELLIHSLDKMTKEKGGKAGSLQRSLTRSTSALGIGVSRSSSGFGEDSVPVSGYTAFCMGPVEGYSLDSADVETVCRQYASQLLDPRVITALNQCSRRRRVHFARTIQLAWRRYLRRKHKWTVKDVVLASRSGRMLELPREDPVRIIQKIQNLEENEDLPDSCLQFSLLYHMQISEVSLFLEGMIEA